MTRLKNDVTTSISDKLRECRKSIRRRQVVSSCIMSIGLFASCVVLLEAVNRLLILREGWSFALVCLSLFAVVAFELNQKGMLVDNE